MLKRDVAVVLVSVFGLWLATRSAGPSDVRFRKAWHSRAMLDSALVPEDGAGGGGGVGGGGGLLADADSPVSRAAAAASRLRARMSSGRLHAHLPRPVVADLNGDGALEVLVATHDFGLRLLRPDAPSSLSSREGFAPAREVAAASLLPTSLASEGDRETPDDPFDEHEWAPAALAVGFLDPEPGALVAAPRKMVVAVVTRGWRVVVLDHNLRRLWSAHPPRDAARALGEGAALHEVAVAVLPAAVRRGDRGLVVVGGSAMRGAGAGAGAGGGELDLTRHFSYFAYEGGKGQQRWTHEPNDPWEAEREGAGRKEGDGDADDDAGPLAPQHAFRLSAADPPAGGAAASSHATHRHHYHHHSYDRHRGGRHGLGGGDAAAVPPSCRHFGESALHALPHAWLTTTDTRLESALFVRHSDGRLLDGPDHEGEDHARDVWYGGPTAQQRRRSSAGLRHASADAAAAGRGGAGGSAGGGGVGGWASRLLFGAAGVGGGSGGGIGGGGSGGGGGAGRGGDGGAAASALVGNDEAFYAQGGGARAAGSAQGRATLTTDAHAGAAARHGGGAGTSGSSGGGGGGGAAANRRARGRSAPRDNALVAHVEGGIEVLHLYSGRPVCRVSLPPGQVVHADLNGDGVVERVSAPPGAAAFSAGAAVGGGFAAVAAGSSGPCVASATTGAPNRRLVWRLDLCALRHPTLEGLGAWMQGPGGGDEADGALGHGGGGGGGASGVRAPAAFAPPAFLPLPRSGDGAYSRLRGQHGLAAFFGSDGVVTGVSARGETLFVEHTLCSWGPPWAAGGDLEAEEEEDERGGGRDAIEEALRKEMGVEALDRGHRAFISTYHDELEREAKVAREEEAAERAALAAGKAWRGRAERRRLREAAAAAAAEANAAGDGREPENFDDYAPAVPTLAALPLRTGAVATALLALGARGGVVLSERGRELDRLHLPHPPVQGAVLADFDGDGLTDVIVVTANGAYGYAQRHAAGGGGFALGSLLAALMLALSLVWWGSVAPPLVGGFGFGGGGGGGGGHVGGVGGGSSSSSSARAAAAAMRQAALKARRSTHWED